MVKSTRLKRSPFKRINSKKMVTKTRHNNLVKLIKNINIKQSESKYKTLAPSNTGALNHNSIKALFIWNDSSSGSNAFPAQGTNDGSRIGDRIICQGFKLRMIIDIPFDRRNTTIKLFYLPYNTAQGNPAALGDLFHSLHNSTMVDPIQTKRWPGLKFLGKFQSNNRNIGGQGRDGGYQGAAAGVLPADEVSSQTTQIIINKWLPVNKKINFIADATLQPSNMKEKGVILMMPYATENTVGTDNLVLDCQYTITTYFKDL
jgi:hypothetical protein